jgi:serine/threonine protein kinase
MRAIDKLYVSHSHPNIVSVLQHGELKSNFYYIDMELCAYNLDDYLSRTPMFHFSPSLLAHVKTMEACEIMLQISNGVAYLHGYGEVHRDLKPRNG